MERHPEILFIIVGDDEKGELVSEDFPRLVVTENLLRYIRRRRR